MNNRVRKFSKMIPYWLMGLILLLIGIILIFVSTSITSPFWESALTKLATAITVTGIFSLVNNLFLSFNLIDIILEKINLKQDIDKYGLTRILTNFNNIPFMDYFNRENDEIVIMHTYGRTWTRQYEHEIRKQIERNSCTVKVIIQDDDSHFIKGLAGHYSTTEEDLKSRINDSVKIWEEIIEGLPVKLKANVELYKVEKLPGYSLYKFDSEIVVILNPLGKGKRKSLNTIIVKDQKSKNSMYDTFKEDLDKIIDVSKNHFS